MISPYFLSKGPLAVNWHMVERCNYSCKFCFSKFGEIPELCRDIEKSKTLIRKLRMNNIEKINFTGGEPLLCSNLGELVRYAKSIGMVTSIVTNGYYITEDIGKNFLSDYGKYLDWIGISLDSGNEEVELQLGRGYGDHVIRVIKAVKLIRDTQPHVGIKINTVVTKLNWKEDMHKIIKKIRPDRWKVFQLKIVDGINEEASSLAIKKEEFKFFTKRHADLNPVDEDEEMMRGSYLMIDPNGRFYDEKTQKNNPRKSLVNISFERAVDNLKFDFERFKLRGGIYQWKRI